MRLGRLPALAAVVLAAATATVLNLILTPAAAHGDDGGTTAAGAPPDPIRHFLSGWAEPEGTEKDAATGYPSRVRRTKDGEEMVLIPAGTFRMGTVPDDKKIYYVGDHSVTLTAAYYLDVMEVTNAQFEKFVAATGYLTTREKKGKSPRPKESAPGLDVEDGASWRTPLAGDRRAPEWAKHPVVLVSWNDARAFAEWVGASLPTEAQFERALRGGREGRKYPWGNDFPPPKASGNYRGEEFKRAYPKSRWPILKGYDDGYVQTAPVGTFPANEFGVRDLSGNVGEWCADWYESDYYVKSPRADPAGPATGSSRVARGSSWGISDDLYLRSSFRFGVDQTNFSIAIGFRCARSLSGR